MRRRFAEGGGGGGSRPWSVAAAGLAMLPRNKPEGPTTATVYVLQNRLEPTEKKNRSQRRSRSRPGITDGSSTEVIEGLKEGDVVSPALALHHCRRPAQPQSNPFAPGLVAVAPDNVAANNSNGARPRRCFCHAADRQAGELFQDLPHGRGRMCTPCARISLEIMPGEFVAIMGASGSGQIDA